MPVGVSAPKCFLKSFAQINRYYVIRLQDHEYPLFLSHSPSSFPRSRLVTSKQTKDEFMFPCILKLHIQTLKLFTKIFTTLSMFFETSSIDLHVACP